MNESEIFENSCCETMESQAFHDFKLLKTTAYSRLWSAIKEGKRFFVKTTKDNTDLQRRMLRREYELSIECDNPHIVSIYTFERNTAVGDAIVMEYIEGRTLDSYLSENPSKRERNRIFSELLSAVGYLHKRGVIHNDIKPKNILITHADNTLKLIDFGLADSDAEYALRTLGCTPRYASPELRSRSSEVDARSDIYSIGVIMAELLGSTIISRRCTAEKPSQRYQTVAQLQASLARYRRAWVAPMVVVLIIAVLLPLLHIALDSHKQRARVAHRAALLERMDREVGRIGKIAADSVAASHYMEFSARHIRTMWERCDSVSKAIIAETDDLDTRSALAVRYGQIYQTLYLELLEQSQQFPAFNGNVGIDEMLFYNQLLEEGKPFRHYTAE